MTIVSKMEGERGRRADDRERDEPNERAESERGERNPAVKCQLTQKNRCLAV